MEDSIKAEKMQAMMKIRKRAHFIYNFILYSLTSLITCLFFSYHFDWFPSMKQLILSSLPNNISYYFSDAKSLFIVVNLIVFILIGESKLRSSSPSPDIYDEYVRRNRSRLKFINSDKNIVLKEEENDGDLIMQSMNLSEEKRHGNMKKRAIRVCRSMQNHDQKEKKSGMRVSRSEVWGETEIAKMEKTMEERESIVPKEELDRRVEAFIARVNKQRLLEAKLEHHI